MADITVLGWQDKYYSKYHPSLFVTFRAKVPHSLFNENNTAHFKDMKEMEKYVVRAKLISDDFNQSINWENSLNGDNEDSKVPLLSSILQSGLAESYTDTNFLIGRTSINVLETLQVFKGLEPQEINLTVEFVAFDNALREVEAPLLTLLKMSLPALNAGTKIKALNEIMKMIKNKQKVSEKDLDSFLGEIPYDIILEYNNKRFSANNAFVISNISSSRDKIQIDKNGNTIRREVSISLKSKKSIVRQDIIIQ